MVGAVRLKRTADDGVLETGIWLARAARGHGIGRAATAAVLREAAALGAEAVRADTRAVNAPALAVLEGLGFRLSEDGSPDVSARVQLDT